MDNTGTVMGKARKTKVLEYSLLSLFSPCLVCPCCFGCFFPLLSLFCSYSVCWIFLSFISAFSETSRDIPFPPLTVPVCPCLSPSVPVYPLLSLSVPVCPCLSLSVPVRPCLSLYFQVFHSFSLVVPFLFLSFSCVTIQYSCITYDMSPAT